MESKEHWDRVYTTTSVNRVSCFQEHAHLSIQLIHETGVSKAANILDVGGDYLIVATFADDGPKKCSGLPVMRYSAETLDAEFGAPFVRVKAQREAHRTPFGTVQQVIYCLCRKAPTS